MDWKPIRIDDTEEFERHPEHGKLFEVRIRLNDEPLEGWTDKFEESNDEVRVEYQEMSAEGQPPVTFFEIDFFGVRVTFDMERRELPAPMRQEAERRGSNILEF